MTHLFAERCGAYKEIKNKISSPKCKINLKKVHFRCAVYWFMVVFLTAFFFFSLLSVFYLKNFPERHVNLCKYRE